MNLIVLSLLLTIEDMFCTLNTWFLVTKCVGFSVLNYSLTAGFPEINAILTLTRVGTDPRGEGLSLTRCIHSEGYCKW